METPTLELTYVTGETVAVEVTSYELKFSSDLLSSKHESYKLGTFKINCAAYKTWPPLKHIVYKIGECSVLTEFPPVTTPRTITYKVRSDWPHPRAPA